MSSESGEDVLIRASATKIAHKWATNVPAGHECYWTVNGTPRRTEPGRQIWFACPHTEMIYAGATITKVEDGRIWFTPLRETDVEPPTEPPTRGFTYIEPLAERLARQLE